MSSRLDDIEARLKDWDETAADIFWLITVARAAEAVRESHVGSGFDEGFVRELLEMYAALEGDTR